MKLVVFRSRLMPEVGDEYSTVARDIAERARQQPGLISFKTFIAADGERVTLAEFASDEAIAAWREDDAHRAAQQAGNDRFYQQYHLQVCTIDRQYGFERPIRARDVTQTETTS